MAAGVSAANLFPPNPANRFFEEAPANRKKYYSYETWISRISFTIPAVLGVAKALKGAGVRSVWINTADRYFIPGLIASAAILGLGFFYTRGKLLQLSAGPPLDTSNSLTKADATHFSSRIDEAQKVKLLDVESIKKLSEWKEGLKTYLDLKGDRHYLGPQERVRIKEMLESFEVFERNLADTAMTKESISTLLKAVRDWIKEHRYSLIHFKKPKLAKSKKETSEELAQCLRRLDPNAPCPEITVANDPWCETLNLLNVSLAKLLEKVEAAPDEARVNRNPEIMAQVNKYNGLLGKEKTRIEKRDRIRAAIIRLLKDEPVDPLPLGITQVKLDAWKGLALTAVRNVEIELVERRILELSYSLLQD